MKRCIVFYLGIVLLLYVNSCTGQENKQITTINNNNNNNNNMIEKIDFEFLEKYAKKEVLPSKTIHYEFKEVQKDGTEVFIGGNSKVGFEEVQIPPLPAYWKEYKRYYPTGTIKEKGKEIRPRGEKIGTWFYYNENGNLISEVDCDKKYGSFSYEQVLNFLIEKKHLGKNHEGIEMIRFSYDEKKQQWFVSATTIAIMYEYCIDGNSGDILSQELFYMEE